MEVAASGRCAECGEPLPANAESCAACGAHTEDFPQRPRFTIAILITLLLVGFAVTGFVVRAYEVRRDQLADRWYRRGDRDLQNGAAEQSINEFQTALAYSRENDLYRLKLALALMQAGKWEEARAHLLNLWEHRPGDGEVNLLLARVFANRNLAANAIRYYHGAIYGVWETNPVANRQAARFELIDFLLAKGQKGAAQSELIALEAESPASPEEQLRLAELMLKADEPERALDLYQKVRRKDRNSFNATLGAAQAEFQLLRFSSAMALAKEAVNLKPDSPEAAQLASSTQALVEADPRTRGIDVNERSRRALRAYAAASSRLGSCAAANPGDTHLQQLATEQHDDFPHLRQSTLRDQDFRDQLLRWVFDVEITTAKACGAPTGADAVLLQLAQAQEKER